MVVSYMRVRRTPNVYVSVSAVTGTRKVGLFRVGQPETHPRELVNILW